MGRSRLNLRSAADRVYRDIKAERIRQVLKWGRQDRPPLEWVSILTEEVGEVAQEANRVYFGGKGADDYRAEMVQVAAVAHAAIESLDRERAR